MSRATTTNTTIPTAINTPLSNLGHQYDQVELYPQGNVQTRLAEITEMIHVASLLHDDVIDGAGDRRGQLSVNAEFGNKMV
jgi:geranylgeranyl pyrophosphate synthase